MGSREKKGVFSTQSMYRFLSDRGVLNGRMQRLWKSKLPMKIKVFLWLAFQDRLPTGIVLKRRNWKGDDRCVVCKVIETSDHIFCHCPLAKFVWACALEALNWDRLPTSMRDFLEG